MDIKFYRIYKVLTDEKGAVIHKTPMARTGNLKTARTHARVWNGVVYACYTDGTEQMI